MPIDINFANIRGYDGSKQKGFEELVCQIAHIEKPAFAKKFVRKEGDGGDAGVECFWTLEDGQEYAWQAKYFIEVFSKQQWSEINKSVEKAISKHPKLTCYYICTPRDRTDSRQEKKGKSVKSALDYWNEYALKWTKLASEKGMNVKFEYWGKHELTNYLQQDKAEYVGKILYWFDAAVVSSDSLLRLADCSRKCLGERFTPECNVELPIAKSLSCIGCDNDWKSDIRKILSNIYDLKKEVMLVKNFVLLHSKKDFCIRFVKEYDQFAHMAFEFENCDSVLFQKLDDYKNLIADLIDMCNELQECIYKEYHSDKELKNQYEEENSTLIKLINDFSKLESFFTDLNLKAGKERKLLITGVGGSGKSHLLCDISMKRLQNGIPTVFLLGQHYSGGDPIKFISENLNLINYSDLEVLGALNALGETYKCRTLIVIDAINEGNSRKDWYYNLDMFLEKCNQFANLAVVISCRSTYVEYIISDEVLKNIPKVNHEGFKGHERRAALKYMGDQGISLPSVPFLSPEFSNPLFLKITCKAIKEMGLKEFPKGVKGFNKVFEFYIDSLEKIVRRKKNIHNNRLVHNAINIFIDRLYPDNIWGISYNEAEKIINDCDRSANNFDSLFDILVFEGLISTDVINNDKEVIRFTYERFSDYALANHILDSCATGEELSKSFDEGGAIFNLLKRENRYANVGVIEALGIEIPERFGKEFIEYIKFKDDNEFQYNWYLKTTFKDGILSRSANAITEKSLELLNQLGGYKYHMDSMDILVSLSTEPNHPWNAEFLDENLRRRPLAKRDLFWSTYVAINDYYEDEDQPESPIRTLLNWVLDGAIDKTDKECLKLTAIILLWMTTTSNRNVRQQATKALSKVFYYIPEQMIAFIKRYNDVDDAYLVTSLYGAVYGAVINIKDKELVKEISDVIIDKQFSTELIHPHILIRDYARGIIEYAYFLGKVTDGIELYRPPYKSKWPLENPLPSEIDKIDKDYSSIKHSVQGFVGDFGKYVMYRVQDWTATPLSRKIASSGKTFHYEFAKTLPQDLRLNYIEVLEQKISKENSGNYDLELFLQSVKSNDDTLDYDKNVDLINKKEKLENDLVYDIEDEDVDIMPPKIEKKEKQVIKKINSRLGEAEQEFFRWIRRQGVSDKPAKFSHRWACRWVIKRAYELGWKKELFDDFESMYCQSAYGFKKGVVERIGKKYQWIAYYELLARLADNLIFADRGYSDVDDRRFYGPWQINIREMDTSYWINGKPEQFYGDINHRWWRPYQFKVELNNLNDQIKWLWDTSNTLPNFKSIICTKSDENKKSWLTLFSFCDWKMNAIKDKDNLGEPSLWYRINTCIVKQKNLDIMKEKFINQSLCDPDLIYIPDSDNQRFLGEYPWHPCYDDLKEWIIPDDWDRMKFPCEYHVPLFEYNWSTSELSHMSNEYSVFYMPSKKIIKEMKLHRDINNPSYWYNENELVFMDPNLRINTQPCALINKGAFCKWLSENNYVLIWLIGGEKDLFTHDVDKFYGRLVYGALYSMNGSGDIEGENWTKKELPNS